MFQILWTEQICSVGMLAFFTVGLAGLIFLAIKYNMYIRDAENMSVTKRKELKAIKTKFLNSYSGRETEEEEKYQAKHVNVEIFVDKAVNKMKIGGLKPHIWRFLCGQSVIVSIVFAGVGIYRSILAERTIGEMSAFYVISFLEIYLYFSVISICSFEDKERLLRLTITEYLENHMLNRIQVVKAFQAEEELLSKLEEEKNNDGLSKEWAQELEVLLQEFIST